MYNCNCCNQQVSHGDVVDAVSLQHWWCAYEGAFPSQYENADMAFVYKDKPTRLPMPPRITSVLAVLVARSFGIPTAHVTGFWLWDDSVYKEDVYGTLPRWGCVVMYNGHRWNAYSIIKPSECLKYERMVIGRLDEHYALCPQYPHEGHRK